MGHYGSPGHWTEIRPEPFGGLAPAGNFDRGASGSEAGGVGRIKTVTAAGEGATESATRSCKSSSADGTGTDVTLFPRQRQRQRPPPRHRPTRRDWTDVVCFSCGKSGHTATCCPNLNEAFPFLQPGWRTEKTSAGIAMIPLRVTTDRRRAENGG